MLSLYMPAFYSDRSFEVRTIRLFYPFYLWVVVVYHPPGLPHQCHHKLLPGFLISYLVQHWFSLSVAITSQPTTQNPHQPLSFFNLLPRPFTIYYFSYTWRQGYTWSGILPDMLSFWLHLLPSFDYILLSFTIKKYQPSHDTQHLATYRHSTVIIVLNFFPLLSQSGC